MSKSSLAWPTALGVALGTLLYACAPTPEAVPPTPYVSVAAEVSPSPTPTPTPTPSATPSVKPSASAPAPSVSAPAPSPSASTSSGTTQSGGTVRPMGAPGGSTSLKAGANHSEAASAWAYPAKDVQRWIKNPGVGPQPADKVVFLTFDDGPTSMTPRVLDALKASGVHATFFVVGANVKGHEAILQRAIAEGHAVAIHTFGHNYAHLYPGRMGNAARITADREKAAGVVGGVLGSGYASSAYRYPGGHMSWKGLGAADDALAKQGVFWIDWNTMTGDAEPAGRRPSSVAGMVAMASPAKGMRVSVMLAHDTPDKTLTLQALPAIIKAYKAAGFTFGIIA